ARATAMSQPRTAFHDPRMRGFRDRAAVRDVLALLDERITALPAEIVPLAHAAGRVLAADVVADVAVPGFDRAAMDGYALHAEKPSGPAPHTPRALRIAAGALPAPPFAAAVAPGEPVRIMPGAPAPAGADAVLPVEQAQEQGGTVQVTGPVSPGRHI